MGQTRHIADVDRATIEAGGGFSVVHETYGFSVRPGAARRRRANLVEWTAQYMGFLTIFATVGLVASSAGLSGMQVDLFEAGILTLCVVVAVIFFWIGTRGTTQELQVDIENGQFRVASRNYRGAERVSEVIPFAEVDSIFVHRQSRLAAKAEFSVRTKAEPRGISILAGKGAAVDHLHTVMTRLMNPAQKAAEVTRYRKAFKQLEAIAAE